MAAFDAEKYNKAKDEADKFFKGNAKMKSACLGEISFNSDGFLHLIWKVHKKHKRDWKNQVKRFHLLPYIKLVLKGMGYYQEYSEELGTFKTRKKIRGKMREVEVSKTITYWGFVAIIDNKIRIKIILRKIGEGNIHFWSVIPFWDTEDYKGIKIISLHKGSPKED